MDDSLQSEEYLLDKMEASLRRLREARELEKVMMSYAAHRARQRLGLELDADEIIAVGRSEGSDAVKAYVGAKIEEWMEEHRAVGRIQGQRTLLRRHVASQYDTDTSRRVGTLLEVVTEQEVLDRLSAAIVRRDSPANLIDELHEFDSRVVHDAAHAEASKEEERAEGRIEGQRALLRKHAASKFDTESSAHLEELLEDATDQEVFDAALSAIVECATPAELRERAAEVRRHTNARGASGGC